jgi:3-hydroxyacyl-CoA dehydrogenase / enoyl-CoA hydratase / 3-hydroxybutyryl-CoA epimerase
MNRAAGSGGSSGEAAAWGLELDADAIAWLTLDKPASSANVLSRPVLLECERLLSSLAGRPLRALVFRSAKPSGFIAGADIREFTTLKSEREALEHIELGQRLCARIEALPCPSVALLHGFALGGGLELALACRYRIALGDQKLKLGLPEVQLGIHPGFGGTVRSVRVLGVRAAMSLMLTGRTVRAEEALRIGLVDRMVTSVGELAAAAREIIAAAPAPHRPPLSERALSWPGVRPWLRASMERRVAGKAPRAHYPAPYAMIELWVRHGARGAAAYTAEAQSVAKLFHSDTARNLIRVFLLQDRLKALGGRSAAAIERVHVVGAGVMGGDIAAWCALCGLSVTLQDRELRFIEPAIARAGALYEKRLPVASERAAALARLQPDVSGAGAAEAAVVIEAIFEDLNAKRALYAAAEPRMRPDALLATNTSSLTLEVLTQTLADPGRFVGLHFFNPVAQMPLIEVVHSAQTRPDVLAAALGFARRIDKLPLPCRSSPGFLVNRVLFPYLYEAMHAAGEGVAFGTIDRAAVEFGMPMGPMELCDVVGLDVVLHVGEIITRELHQQPPAFVERLRALVGEGRLGRKSGHGLYSWSAGKIVRTAPSAAPAADLGDRLIFTLINECVACAREGIVADLDLIDAGVIFGTGFAPFRGGPLAYARQRGIDACLAVLARFEQQLGSRFRADAGWALLR